MKKTYKQRIDQSRWRQREASIFIPFIKATHDQHTQRICSFFPFELHHDHIEFGFLSSFASKIPTTIVNLRVRFVMATILSPMKEEKTFSNLETGSIQLVPLSQQESSKPLKQIVTYFLVYLIQLEVLNKTILHSHNQTNHFPSISCISQTLNT